MDKNTVDIWNQFYTNRGRFYLVPHHSQKKAATIFQNLDVKNILDLGCGSGRHIVSFAEQGFNVVGIDYAPSAVDLAQKWILSKNLKAKAYIADIHDEIKFIEDGSYDAVLAIKSLNFTDIETFKKSLLEINRILKTGGLLYLVVPTENSIINDLKMEQLYFTQQEIKELLDERYRILEIGIDKDNFISIIAQEK